MFFQEKRLKRFMQANEKEAQDIMTKHNALFNKLAKEGGSADLQLGLTGVLFYSILKSTNMPRNEKVKLLENLIRQIKKE